MVRACCEPAAAVALGALSDGQLRLRHIACDACERLSEAESVARRCSRVVQLRMNVLTAADQAQLIVKRGKQR